MAHSALWFLPFLLVVGSLTRSWQGVHSQAVKEKVYVTLTNAAPCVRLLNNTHQTGCQSAFRGNVGVLHLLASPFDVIWILKSGPHPPYIPLIPARLFNRTLMIHLRNSTRIAGALLMIDDKNVTLLPSFSHEKQCPNDGYGIYMPDSCDVEWNEVGTGLDFEDFPFPIFMLSDKHETDVVIKCYEKHNILGLNDSAPDYPLCAAQLSSHMHAVTDTVTCRRRSSLQNNLTPQVVCDPLGCSNVMGLLLPDNRTNSVVFAITRLDSRSFFWDRSPGAGSVVTSFITLLAAAEALAKLPIEDINRLEKNIAFTFFQGEAFDYIGSSRLVFDMLQNRSFFTLDEVDSVLEIGQVFRPAGDLWAHTDPISNMDSSVKNGTEELVKLLSRAGLNVQRDETLRLPPASLQQFLKYRNLSGVLLSDYHNAFRNKYYQSVLDTVSNLDPEYPHSSDTEDALNYIGPLAANLTSIATGVARTLYLKAARSQSSEQNVTASNITVARLLYSFLVKTNNSWIRSLLDKDADKSLLVEHALSTYVGVTVMSMNPLTRLLYMVMSNLTGKRVSLNETACKDPAKYHIPDREMYKYMWIVTQDDSDGVCVRSTTRLLEGISPAFLKLPEGMHQNDFSTWTESQWKLTQARLFLVSSPWLEHLTLAVGFVVLILSFASVYLINSKVDVLFSGYPSHARSAY
uniref:nicastrin n=1 Tax=Myxine glutinosa TaxID=7769 RepID=UPI00358FE7AE